MLCPALPIFSENIMKTVFVKRLGRHHFAHLRAIAEGLDLQTSAKRYLGVEHGHEAKTAHRQTVEAVRMLACIFQGIVDGVSG